jgi:hypothetical protein
MLRVSVVSLALGALIIGALKANVPGMQVPPVWKLLLALPIFYFYALVMLALHLAVPSHVTVRSDRIHVSTGQSGWMKKADDIRATRVVIFAPDRIRVRVFYEHKGRVRSRTYGVSRRVKLDELCAALPKAPQIWDARGRYALLTENKLSLSVA